MNSSRGSSSRSKQKKGSSSKQNKPPSNGDQSPFYTWHIIGGNPLEPGTNNYKKLKDRYQELFEMCRTQPTDFYICEDDPFSLENLREAPYFNPNDPDNSLYSEIFWKASFFNSLFPDPKPSESKVAGPPNYGYKAEEQMHLTPIDANAPDPKPSESKFAGPPNYGPGLKKSRLPLLLPEKSALVQTAGL